MAWFDNIRNAMHPYDDDYIENEEAAAEEELAQEEEPEVQDDYEERQPRPVFSRRENKPASAPAPAQEKQKMKLKFVKPTSFDEAAEIADSLKSRQAVLMNLEMTETDTSRRLLDFLSGVAYALGGKIMRVSAQAYIIAPTNVDLVGDAIADFESAGLYF
jgi:cell division inhibitor SepF